MAKLLRVRTGKFSLIPAALPDGRLQLGYVETARADIIRDSLIGIAPLIAGSLFVAYAGIIRMQLNSLWTVVAYGNMELLLAGLRLLPGVPDFYLWFYLVFAVSSTMLPSESDRRAWLPLGLWALMLVALALFSGAGMWMLQNLAPSLNSFLNIIALLFGLSLFFHVILLLPIMAVHRIAARVTGLDVK